MQTGARAPSSSSATCGSSFRNGSTTVFSDRFVVKVVVPEYCASAGVLAELSVSSENPNGHDRCPQQCAGDHEPDATEPVCAGVSGGGGGIGEDLRPPAALDHATVPGAIDTEVDRSEHDHERDAHPRPGFSGGRGSRGKRRDSYAEQNGVQNRADEAEPQLLSVPLVDGFAQVVAE